MAELNFGLLTPPGSQSIGNAFVTGMDQAQESRARDLQMQQSVRQGQMAELQYKKAQDTEARLNQWYAGIAKNGGPTTAIEIENQMMDSGIPQVINMGLSARMARFKIEQDRKLYAAVNAPAPAAGAGPMSPAVVPEPGSFGADVMERRAANLFAPRTNMLAGASAEVNNLGAPPQVRSQIDALNARINANLALGTEQGNKTAEMLQKQADNLSRRYTVGTALMSGDGDVVGIAPAAKSEFETLLANSGLSESEKTAARQARVGQLSTTSYEYLTVLDRLGKTTDPTEREFLKGRLAQLSTHPLPTQLKVNTFVPASEEAQRDFIKSTRATYDTLKQSPAMFANIAAAKKLIPSASAFMGAGGEGLKTAASFLNNRLGMNINIEGVKDATELQSRLFQGIMDNLRKLDAQPSERQQAALQEALGSLATDPKALSNVLDAFADSVRNKIDIHNAEVRSAIARGVKFPYDPIIKMPAKATAGNVTTNSQYPGFSIGEP